MVVPMNAKRGFVPEDEKYFSAEAIETMRIAAGHILYLINAEYDLKQAATFVGNHFLLSERQRLAIMRSVATHEQVRSRREKSVDLLEVEGQEVWIDGFNIIITLEVLLSDSLIFECMDGSIRDLAALRGTYRIIPETRGAIRLLLEELQAACVKKANILLDEPVSGLDPKVTAEMYRLIKELNQKDGTTIIMISHDLSAAVAYASHILHIGETVFFGTKQAYLSSAASRSFTVGKGGETDE